MNDEVPDPGFTGGLFDEINERMAEHRLIDRTFASWSSRRPWRWLPEFLKPYVFARFRSYFIPHEIERLNNG